MCSARRSLSEKSATITLRSITGKSSSSRRPLPRLFGFLWTKTVSLSCYSCMIPGDRRWRQGCLRSECMGRTQAMELCAAQRIVSLAPRTICNYLLDLWKEFEAGEKKVAWFAKSIDICWWFWASRTAAAARFGRGSLGSGKLSRFSGCNGDLARSEGSQLT